MRDRPERCKNWTASPSSRLTRDEPLATDVWDNTAMVSFGGGGGGGAALASPAGIVVLLVVVAIVAAGWWLFNR